MHAFHLKKNAAKAVQTKGCLKRRARFSHKRRLYGFFFSLLCISDLELVQVYLLIILAGDLQDLQM